MFRRRTEACGGSHHWARELQSLGHEVKMLPPQYVKAYVKRGKNDAVDAEASGDRSCLQVHAACKTTQRNLRRKSPPENVAIFMPLSRVTEQRCKKIF
jgi:transposase